MGGVIATFSVLECAYCQNNCCPPRYRCSAIDTATVYFYFALVTLGEPSCIRGSKSSAFNLFPVSAYETDQRY